MKYLQTLADSGAAALESRDLLYLDSCDFDRANPVPSAAHHRMELLAIAPRLRPETMVVVDDAFVSLQEFLSLGGQLMLMGAPIVPIVEGKARFSAEYAGTWGGSLDVLQLSMRLGGDALASLIWRRPEVTGLLCARSRALGC